MGTDDKMYITCDDFIDCIYEWCITKKKIGFKIDW